ncbi:hypothetical protein C6341_g6296 [Phytophthora cactorum]|nr:hypothetical protein C6341_g6296 [Phytophthora cactorum]
MNCPAVGAFIGCCMFAVVSVCGVAISGAGVACVAVLIDVSRDPTLIRRVRALMKSVNALDSPYLYSKDGVCDGSESFESIQALSVCAGVPASPSGSIGRA